MVEDLHRGFSQVGFLLRLVFCLCAFLHRWPGLLVCTIWEASMIPVACNTPTKTNIFCYTCRTMQNPKFAHFWQMY